jgi:uncharacterized Zn finger protein (UPF0148 family)
MGGHGEKIVGPSGYEPDSELRRRRDELAEQVAELQWNLGGLAYEMAIRDHFRLDVLVRRAALLQERDAELAEVKRLLHMEETSIVGTCASCGAVRSRGAVFCWQCGAKVMDRIGAGDEGEAVTLAQDANAVKQDANAVKQDANAVKQDANAVEQDANTVELVAPIVREEVDRASAQPVQAPAVGLHESDPRDSAPVVATHGDESELGRPVQTGS